MLPENDAIQQKDMADRMKLTAVTISSNGNKMQVFVMLEYDSRGHAIMPPALRDKLLDKAGIRPGDTYTIG